MKHLVIVDGMGFVFRAYHAVRAGLTRSDGLPTNALFGFAQMLVKVVQDLRPDGCVVALDSKGPNWRHGMYPLYKANRTAPDEALVRQLPLIEPLVNAFGLPVLKVDGVEADDVIATLVANHTAERVTIVTSDKDLMQLVGDFEGPPTLSLRSELRRATDSLSSQELTKGIMSVRLLDTFKDKFSGVAECVEKFGVAPELVADVQGLMGDSSDNIPGVRGIGPKGAAELVQKFGPLERIYERLGEVEKERVRGLLMEHKGQAFLSRDLARLKADVVLPAVDLAFHPRLHEAAGYLREVLEFKTLAGRLEGLGRLRPPQEGGGSGEPSLGSLSEQKIPRSNDVKQGSSWGEPEVVLTLERWRWWVGEIRRVGVVAIDTETTGLDPYTARLVGVSVFVGGRGAYVPVQMIGGTSGQVGQGGLFDGEALVGPHGVVGLDILADVQALLADEKVLKIGHNLKFDWQVFARALGITPGDTGEVLQTLVRNYDDTMLMSACLDAGRWGHGLDDLAERHLGHKMITFEDVCGKGKAQVTFDKVLLERAAEYAVEDVWATFKLWEIFSGRMKEGGLGGSGLSVVSPLSSYRMMTAATDKKELASQQIELQPTAAGFGVRYVYEKVERPLVPVIVALEARGVRVDEVFLKELSADFASRMAVLEREIWRLAGHEFNVQSTQQLAVVLFDELGLGNEKQRKSRSTAVGVLEDMLEDGVAIAKVMVEYRQLMKLRSTYAEALGRQVNPITKRVHTHYMQMGAATGRFSSNEPNLQNIPIRTEEGRKIRKAFVAREGWKMVSADYSQIELRLLAHLSGSVALTRAFVEGVDIHAYTASLVRGVPLGEVTKEQRRAAKFINFGLVYGMGARSLAGQIGCSVSEAQAWIEAYFKRYDGVREYMDLNKRKAKEQGFVETLLGRRVWLPEIASTNAGLRAGAERAAINAPLQGSNADIIKLAMQQLGRLRPTGSGEPSFGSHGELRAQMIMQVHDELVFEAPEEEIEALRKILPEVMGGVVRLSVPLVVEVGVGGDWDGAH